MNFLAHVYLSCDHEELLIGNFIADFIRNRDLAELPAGIRQGVELHRQIDTYTDQHAIVKRGTHRLQPRHGKYAPVLLDIFYDYLLTDFWDQYSGEPLAEFTQNVYEVLEKWMDIMPKKLQTQLPGMIAGDWLSHYGHVDGLEFVLKKMDQRTSFPSHFRGASKDLLKDYALYAEEFNQFFPELIDYVETQCKC